MLLSLILALCWDLLKYRAPATDVCPHVAEYLTEVFDCALSGPFDNLFLARLSAPQALCRGIIAVISASTVFLINFSLIILPFYAFVNSLVQKSYAHRAICISPSYTLKGYGANPFGYCR